MKNSLKARLEDARGTSDPGEPKVIHEKTTVAYEDGSYRVLRELAIERESDDDPATGLPRS